MAASEPDATPANTSVALAAWQDALAETRDAFSSWQTDLTRAVAPFQTPEDPFGDGLSGAIVAAEASLKAIIDRLEAAHHTLMAAYGEAVKTESPDTVNRLEWQRTEQTRTLRSQAAQMSDQGHAAVTRAAAAAARALFEAASREWNQPRSCRSCETPIFVGGVWQPTTFTCGSCGDKITFDAEPLTARFYAGPSLDVICAEHALDAWQVLLAAQRRFEGMTHALPRDFESYEAATRSWATAYATLYGELHPAWSADDVSEAIQRRTEDTLDEAGSEAARARRTQLAEGAAVAAEGDLAKLMAWAQAQATGTDMADLIADLAVCVHEHDDRANAWQVIALQHHIQREAQDRDTWMRERLTQLDAALRGR